MSYLSANFYELLKIFIVSMLPVSELRGAVPYGISLGLDPLVVLTVSILGNIFVIPFILVLVRPVMHFLTSFEFMKKITDWIMQKIHSNSKQVLKYELVGLFLLVALPLPSTGVWTASAVASFLDIRIKNSFIAISAGVVTAGAIVYFLTHLGIMIIK